jgi:opacity protein-like surface antigen
MRRLIALTVAVAVVGLAMSASAADATGTWKWTATIQGKTRDSTAKLKQEGDKLTGVYVGGQSNDETPIEDAKISGDKISFKVTRERGGQKFTTSYSGTLKDDTITGTSERERDGQKQSSEWVAKRQK